MERYVLDSWALMEWIEDSSPAAEAVDTLLRAGEAGQAEIFLGLINAGEVFYVLAKRVGMKKALAWRDQIRELPVTLVTQIAEQDVWRAATLKARHRISYADAFAAGLAIERRAKLVTGDPDFARFDECEVHWLG